MNDIQITPDNIVSIVIQYQSNSIYPFRNSNNANIFVVIDTSQQIQIGLQEILPYINQLKAKADALADGSVVISTQGANDDGSNFDRFTVIKVGQPLQTTIPNTLTVTTPTGLHDSDFTPIVNVSSVLANVISASNSPAIVSLKLPIINGDFFDNDYIISFDSGAGFKFLSGAFVSFNSWQVYLIWTATVTGNQNITISAKQLRANLVIKNSGGININQLNSISGFGSDLKAVNGVGYKPQSDILGGTGNFDTPLLNGEQVAFRLTNQISNVIGAKINGDFTVSSAQDMTIYASGANNVKQTTTNVGASGNQDLDLDFDLNAGIDTAPASQYVFIDVLSGGGTPPPPVGVAVSAAAGNTGTSAAMCPLANTTYYTDDGTITTGKTVYTDINLTTPLSGFDFILSPDGNVYFINNVTGVVGAANGSSCHVPITGKSLFVVGIVTTHLDVDGTDYGAQGAGANYNVTIKSNSIITNNSGGSRTFSYYVSPPFIPANLIVSNFVANGGTDTLPNNISNYNYLRIT